MTRFARSPLLIFQHASGVQKRSPAGLLEISPELSEAKLGVLGTDDGAPRQGCEDNFDSCGFQCPRNPGTPLGCQDKRDETNRWLRSLCSLTTG